MEPKFQTSFIPKKQNSPALGGININNPLIQKPKAQGSSIFMVIAVIVFVISIGAAGGAFAWKYYLGMAGEKLKIDLASMEKQFNVELIEKLKEVNTQIDTAKRIVGNHVAMSRIFEVLQKVTIADVRFLSMGLRVMPENENIMTLEMKGQGKNLAAVAFQSDVLNKLEDYGLAGVLKNPMILDPVLESNNLVSFGLTAEVSRSSMSYEGLVSETSSVNTGNSFDDLEQ